jgi:hypothetical protein
MRKLLLALVIVSTSAFAQSDPIVTQSTSTSTSTNNSTVTTNGATTTTLKSPPPSAISPAITIINNDVCAVAASGAVQTQILGISMGGTTTDYNCERIKLSRSLYDMGMKVAAVSVMCQDRRVFDAMVNAGTPCPIDGKIGQEAATLWEANPERKPNINVNKTK